MPSKFTIEEPFTCEVKVKRVAFSSSQGPSVTLDLPDTATMDALVGTEGGRFQLALIRIIETDRGEELAHSTPPPPAKMAWKDLGPLCREANELCGNALFHEWATAKCGQEISTPKRAAEFVYASCDVCSRKELDTDPDAGAYFIQAIRLPFGQWLQDRREQEA